MDLVSYNRLLGVCRLLVVLQLHFLFGFDWGQLHFFVRVVVQSHFLFCAVVLVRLPSLAEQLLVFVPVLNFAEQALVFVPVLNFAEQALVFVPHALVDAQALVLVPDALVDAQAFTPVFCFAEQFLTPNFVALPEHTFVFVEQFFEFVEPCLALHPLVLSFALHNFSLLEPLAFVFFEAVEDFFVAIFYLLKIYFGINILRKFDKIIH